jgi:hypothetical protein
MGIFIQAYTCPWSNLSFSNGKAFCWGYPIIVGASYYTSPYVFNFIIHFQHIPPHQFVVVIKRGCEEVVHGINAPFICILIGYSHKLMLPMHLNVLHVVMF